MNKKSEPSLSARRPRWRLRTLIEILPILIALTVLFSYTTIKGVSTIQLVTPLSTVLETVPTWVALLMIFIAIVGVLGMAWIIFIFTRAAVSAGGNDE